MDLGKLLRENGVDANLDKWDLIPGQDTTYFMESQIRDSDFVILVTEPTPFGLHDLKLAIDTMIELKKKFGVVVNRYGIGNEDVITYCEDENIPVLAKIPNKRRIAELYSSGKLIYREVVEVQHELDKIITYIETLSKGGIS